MMTHERLKTLNRIRKAVLAFLFLICAAAFLIGFVAFFQNAFWGFAWLLTVLFAGVPLCLLLAFLLQAICAVLTRRTDACLVSVAELVTYWLSLLLAFFALLFGLVFVTDPAGGWAVVGPLTAFLGLLILKLIRVALRHTKKMKTE